MHLLKWYFVEDKNTTTSTNGNEPVSIAAIVEVCMYIFSILRKAFISCLHHIKLTPMQEMYCI